MRKTVITILFFAVLGTAFWFGRPVYREYKETRFAKQAQEALARNEHRKALLNARQALVINSNNLVACEVMASLADLSRSAHAMIWRRRAVDIDPSLENRLALVTSALRYEPAPFTIAAQTLKDMAVEGQNSMSFQLVSAQLALKQNRTADAEKHIERVREIDPTNALHRLNLAVIRLESKDAAVSAAAHAELEQFQTSRWRANALRSLVVHHQARRQFADAMRYSTLLLNETNAVFSDKLEHLSILHRAKSPELNSFLARVQKQAETNVLQAADLVLRMTGLGLGVEAIAWSKTLSSEIQNGMPLPVMLADSYSATKQWRQMEQYLTAQQWREQDYLRQALLAFALRNQKADDVAAVHWNDAVQKGVERPELALMLAQLSSRWGWTNETETLLWRAARQFQKERWPVESLQNNYARMRNTRGLFEVNVLLLQREPGNAVVQNNWAALALLLQTNLAKAHQLARQVHDRDTNNAGFVSTYAWSLHVQRRTPEALKVIETLNPADLAKPSIASYYGALLAAAGQSDKARQYLAKAEVARILPEELNLIAEARKQL